MISLETTLYLRGSYSEADFTAALGLTSGSKTLDDARQALLNQDRPTVLVWHNFHGARVGDHTSEAMAAWLRAIAHEAENLRLVFFDEEGQGQ